jgi:alkanesulfonate monooxygenase SsuD/methylene tetrahydromethanopterin reductase-like flavin-dependent oxidoreductase (luciferase family)
MAVGPSICAALRYWIHASGLGSEASRPLAHGIEPFRSWMQHHNIDPDQDYGRFYEHYFLRLPQEHLDILDEELVRTMVIIGSPEDCLEKVQGFAQAGVTDFALLLGGNAHELMRHFAQAVICRW